MTAPHDLVFLLDVDNTLLNNDQVITDLQGNLARQLGAANARAPALALALALALACERRWLERSKEASGGFCVRLVSEKS